MDAEQAWQSALGQLQIEMPRAAFDTWVRDTRLVTYEDGRFVIGARSAYARDWLARRLSSTVTRLLMGRMNRSVEVEFVDDKAGTAAPTKSNPVTGLLKWTESMTLPSGLRRMKFEQCGQIPDMDVIWEKYVPKDGRHICCYAWMDENEIGHVYLAWKEKK